MVSRLQRYQAHDLMTASRLDIPQPFPSINMMGHPCIAGPLDASRWKQRDGNVPDQHNSCSVAAIYPTGVLIHNRFNYRGLRFSAVQEGMM
jgi:hypothetical protein